ncbi:MAG TPA: SdrD B-like domain-containing protein, partial [Terriglobia bacterium]|nr:SdrD B-like domain-containing protein [Terriglobia bacterium]
MRTWIFRRLTTLVGLLAAFAMPAFANHIDSSTVSANCTGYTIHVDGGNLNTTGATFVVNYVIVLTPSSGPVITVNGSISVTPDANLNFSATESKLWADIGVNVNGTYALSGSATLFINGEANNSVAILFTPATLVCQNLCTGSMGDFVWNDVNQNGIQDSGELGIPNITVQLWNGDMTTLLQATTTDANGVYHFLGLCGGTYKVVVPSQPGLTSYVPSAPLQGGPATDSNPNPFIVTLPNNATDNTIDFGFYFSNPHLTITKSPKNGVFAQGSQVTFTLVV